MKARTKIFLFLLLCIICGTTALPLKAQSFDIKAFSDTTKYGWKIIWIEMPIVRT